ncbi:MAG: hypothetical protein PHV82_04830 [Victivallaceae bacterium]|nr:hypothetical protein [Victivallaceae bacterium]
MIIIMIATYIVLQVMGALLFKWGSEAQEHWLTGFILGNTLAFSSIWILMNLFKQMNPNIAMGICGGSASLLAQIAIAWVFRTHINYLQWLGIGLITCGIVILCIFKNTASITR